MIKRKDGIPTISRRENCVDSHRRNIREENKVTAHGVDVIGLFKYPSEFFCPGCQYVYAYFQREFTRHELNSAYRVTS